MRAVLIAVAAVFAFALAPERCFAQALLPPLVPGPEEGPGLVGGKEISQPLTSVEVPTAPEPAEKPSPVQRVEEVQQQKLTRRGPLGTAWGEDTLLIWWPKAAPIPALVTATRNGSPPVFGNPNTTLLVGGQALANPNIEGGRFTSGWSLNEDETVGMELRYFFLGSRTNKATIYAINNPRFQALGLPYIDAVTGQDVVFPLAAPGLSRGSVYTTTTTRMQGAEANAVANLWDEEGVRINGLVGYRFLQVHEGLTVQQLRYSDAGKTTIYDEFDGHNRFNGGQLGLHTDLSHGVVYCELTGKIALGQTYEVVKIDGATNLNGVPLPGGLFALPSNMGRYARGVFAVVPEGTIKFGLKLGDAGRFYVGYNFLYLSDMVRPGDQIDRTLNTAMIPALNPNGNLASLLGPDRPRPILSRSDYWAQGLMIGLETRY